MTRDDRLALALLLASVVLLAISLAPPAQPPARTGQGDIPAPRPAAPPVRYTAADRAVMIRTVIGEAWHPDPRRRQPRLGARAVAWVIINRVRDGRFGGRTISKVCLAKWQFEPWMTRRRELLAIGPGHSAWKWAASVVDPILAGRDSDPTSGALFFLNPLTVRARRRDGRLPRWAVGRTLVTSADNPALVHHFYTGPKVAGWFRTLDDLLEKEREL